MNKKFAVQILKKDIAELELLTKGFEEMDVFPKAILELAEQKANMICKTLSELGEQEDKQDIIEEEVSRIQVEDEVSIFVPSNNINESPCPSPKIEEELLEVTVKKNTFQKPTFSKKIDDIRTVISIGDRFRFQRELFGGNGETMNKAISYLNQLATYEEAETYLANKFAWTEDNLAAEDFLNIIKRRY